MKWIAKCHFESSENLGSFLWAKTTVEDDHDCIRLWNTNIRILDTQCKQPSAIYNKLTEIAQLPHIAHKSTSLFEGTSTAQALLQVEMDKVSRTLKLVLSDTWVS